MIFRILNFVFILFLLTLPTKGAERYAILIGNSEYKHLPKLTTPTNDIEIISKSLEESKFNIFKYNNLNLNESIRFIDDFSSFIELKRKNKHQIEAVLFYYAGHGVQFRGNNYMVPIDATDEPRASAFEKDIINLNDVIRRLNKPKSQNYIFVIDACRDSPYSGDGFGAGLAEVDAGINNFVSFSAKPGSVALDGDDKNSPFAASLQYELLKHGQPIEVTFRNVRRTVYEKTEGFQLPWDSSSLISEFEFIPTGTYGERELDVDPNSQAEALWQAIKQNDYEPRELRKYLFMFPRGAHAKEARSRLKE